MGGFAGGTGASGVGGDGRGGGGGGIGGAIFAKAGVVEIANCTFVRNHASGGDIGGATAGIGAGGGIFNYGASVSLQNSVLAFNTADTNAEIGGIFVSGGFNLIKQPSPAFSALSSDLIEIDPHLPALPNLSGEVPCYLPLPGSPLLDRGRSPVFYDQRGQRRQVDHPESFDYPGGDLSDIGAVELDLDHRIISFEHHLDQLRLTFNTVPGKSYNVRYRIDLRSPWQVLPETVLGNGHWMIITNLPIPTAGFFQIGRQ